MAHGQNGHHFVNDTFKYIFRIRYLYCDSNFIEVRVLRLDAQTASRYQNSFSPIFLLYLLKSITALGICIDENLTFDEHVNNICLKASRQISALQRLTGFIDMPGRKAIYNSFIVSNFNYCPLVWFFTSRESINKMQKIQERALRFVLKDSTSDYDTLLTKCGVDSFRISSLKSMAVEIYKILNEMSPEYLSLFPKLLSLLPKSSIPYSLRDNNKLIQQKMKTTTFGLKSFTYYGAHLWNPLPVDIKSALTICLFSRPSFIQNSVRCSIARS